MELWQWHRGFGPAVSNMPPSTSQHGKTAFAQDHALGPVTLWPLCPGRREQPAPSLPCWAGPEEQLILGHKGTLGTVTSWSQRQCVTLSRIFGRNDPHTC